MQNMMWAISSVLNPRVGVPRMRKNESRDAPITISGVAIGTTIRKFAVRRPKNRWRTRAMAISVPMAVAMTVAKSRVELGDAEDALPVVQRECDPGEVVLPGRVVEREENDHGDRDQQIRDREAGVDVDGVLSQPVPRTAQERFAANVRRGRGGCFHDQPLSLIPAACSLMPAPPPRPSAIPSPRSGCRRRRRS